MEIATSISAISAVGTLAAVGVAVWVATKQERDRKRHQAELVTAWLTPYTGEQDHPGRFYEGLHLQNASQQLIYDCIAQVVAVQGSARHTAVGDTEERNTTHGARIGNLRPGVTSSRINTGGGGMHLRFAVEVAFQDAAGRYWLRRGNGKLERIKKHPLDLYGIGRPVGWEN